MEGLKKMRNEIEIEELLGVLESIRQREYPNIPSKVIRDIVLTQFENQDNRALAQRNTKKIIDDFLKEEDATMD